MKILVTGGNGQLGSEIRQLSNSNGHHFEFIDIEDLDLTSSAETQKYLEEEKPDVIVNCAAYTAVDKAESDQAGAYAVNVGIPGNLGAYSQETGCRLIHVSTDYVFSGEAYQPWKETDPTEPKSIYGKSKLEGEKILENCSNCAIIRTSWLYSSFGNNFVKSMLRLFREKDELGIVYDQVGTPTYGADLAAALMVIVNCNADEFVPGIYQYSNEGVASWYDFALEILGYSDEQCKIRPIETKDYPLPAPRPYYSVMSKEKIKNDYSIEIPHWKSGLERCLKILLK